MYKTTSIILLLYKLSYGGVMANKKGKFLLEENLRSKVNENETKLSNEQRLKVRSYACSVNS